MSKGQFWRQSAAEGFTLIEVLASVIIVALAMTALAPALTLVAYRRAMSERVELANRLAQEEVDRIRTLVDIELSAAPKAFQDPAQRDRLPRVGEDPLANTPPPDEMPADANDGNYTHKDNYSLRLAQVQVPGRNPEEYVIQTFRDEGAPCIDRRENRVIQGCPAAFAWACGFTTAFLLIQTLAKRCLDWERSWFRPTKTWPMPMSGSFPWPPPL